MDFKDFSDFAKSAKVGYELERTISGNSKLDPNKQKNAANKAAGKLLGMGTSAMGLGGSVVLANGAQVSIGMKGTALTMAAIKTPLAVTLASSAITTTTTVAAASLVTTVAIPVAIVTGGIAVGYGLSKLVNY